ncbi:MAG: S41 family peptidase [Muribaculaceae bacterium]|nr:S41 family peptidase [Muribaculaceae bacterium]
MKKLTLTVLAAAVLLPFANYISGQQMQLSPNNKLRMAEQIIENYYVEDVDADSVVQEAIVAMLKTLDPHSSYSTPEETTELTQPLEGKFSGIGIQFNMSTDTVYVIQTTGGGPSEKVGIMPGDKIISANDTLLAGRKLPNSKILKTLRGEKGSKVKLMVKRGDSPELLEFIVTRDDIPLYSVSEAYMVDDKTGYIAVSRFAEDTPKEVREAAVKLLGKGMKQLIIDLQDNGGGYLGAACQMAADFLKAGDPVVYTAGRNSAPQHFNLDSDGILPDIPVVVMVNQYSASASEIFSGAMQDNDRGLVVGRRTFGKGLVQRPFPFPDGSMIRLTTARYYTPSGRCIQKHYDKGHSEEYQLDMLNRFNSGELWSADSIKLIDSLKYQTLRNHRTVYGGGGILPDIFVPVDTTYFTQYYRSMLGKGSLNAFVLNYVDSNRKQLTRKYPDEDSFFKGFDVTDDMLQALIERTTADSTEYNEEQWNRSRPYVTAVIKGLISRDLFERGSFSRATNMFDPVFKAALEAINDPKKYNQLLGNKE